MEGCIAAPRSTMCAAMARGVGCSNATIAESVTFVAARRRADSSVAASESTPASRRGTSRSTAAPPPPMSDTVLSTTRSTSAGTSCVTSHMSLTALLSVS